MRMVEIDFDKSRDGLVPVIVQNHENNDVLMLAYANESALEKTLITGKAHYWSRSRKQLWLKGESSGNIQTIREILVDCDGDTLIYKVEQAGGAACHKGYPSCFYRKIEDGLLVEIEERVFDPETVYKK